ncbi:glycosyltransferase [Spirulina sp. CS-785/01]|uniref:glycosyltransferase n=1 Tax=Spirulina sp. CS-785/01 TaxID=3021716 RepID=UPI0023314C88|nr:glycosyltransferase [Spirulina sp. CS-785/01]MDB9311788.1 glycosyltransferase [Spirulina sp. CS-785/01]
MFGHGGEEIAEEVGMEGMHLGYVASDRLKAIAYSAADISILPTRLDNLPLGIQESFACGTPVVSFAVGVVPELVQSYQTGYLASPEDAQDLSGGIVELLHAEGLRGEMGKTCRERVEQDYTLELKVQRYSELYHKLLQWPSSTTP